MEELKNQPSATLSGSTWDAKHLDNFLSSEWGEKLYKTSKPSPFPSYQKPNSFFQKSSIKPSASFLSYNRDNQPLHNIEKPQGSSLLEYKDEKYGKNPFQGDPLITNFKMKELEDMRRRDMLEYQKVLSPFKRRQLLEAEKTRNQAYSELKNERLLGVKRQRILKGEYPEGILGVDSARRADFSPLYANKQKEYEKYDKEKTVSRLNRAKNIMDHTCANQKIVFFNDPRSEDVKEKATGMKRAEDGSRHYHDTYAALFTPESFKSQNERAERLLQLGRGNRDFNIISGAEY